MGKSKRRTTYKPMPYTWRHWMHSESCYNEEELNLRQLILNTRAASGIDPEYLANPNSWFAPDQQALINHYENSWFFSSFYRTRHEIRRIHFQVHPINSQRLHWPVLYDLMQMVGDYLFVRNHDLPQVYLNHPMNFAFLDLNFILRALSQNSNVNQVKEQITLVNRYVRTLEAQITSIKGSDRLFLANFRSVIDDTIEPQLTLKIESQLLRERLNNLAKTVKQVSTERNRVLHFALNINPVNPHTYDFSTELVEASKAYPTQAAKACASSSKDIATTVPAILQLTVKELKECTNFKLISMTDDILKRYATAMSDLNELERFQTVISQSIDLLNQAGEVYTVFQFKEKMSSLLQEMNSFIDNSSQHIEAIINANTQEYSLAIHAQQDAWFWEWSEKKKLQTFIKNHDILSQFPSSIAELRQTTKTLGKQVDEVIEHLTQPKTNRNNFEGLTKQAHELNQLMDSMHNWIQIQYEKKGLPAPKPPKHLALLPNPTVPSSKTILIPAAKTFNHSQRISRDVFFQQPLALDTYNNNSPLRYGESNSRQIDLTTLALLALVPLAIYVLYLFVNRNKKKEPVHNERADNWSCLELLDNG